MRIISPVCFLTSLLALPCQSYAGAWTQAQGNTLLITSASYYNADNKWSNAGNHQSQPTYDKYELSPYLEYGLRDDLTLGANMSLQRVHQDAVGTNGSSRFGIGDSEFFLRKRLWHEGGYVLSAEPMLKLPNPLPASSQPRVGSRDADAGLGLLGGYGFSAYGQNHYADIDTRYRYRFGSPNDQVNISGTLGIGLSPQWTVMPQTFMTFRTSHQANVTFTQSPSDDYNLIRLQLSGLYKLSDETSLQFGGFHDVDGKNAGEGNGVLLALWKHL